MIIECAAADDPKLILNIYVAVAFDQNIPVTIPVAEFGVFVKPLHQWACICKTTDRPTC